MKIREIIPFGGRNYRLEERNAAVSPAGALLAGRLAQEGKRGRLENKKRMQGRRLPCIPEKAERRIYVGRPFFCLFFHHK